jgi:hypothetical protein
MSIEEAFPDGHYNNFNIKPHGPVFDIIEVTLNAFLQGSITPPTIDLCLASKPGFHLQT